LLASDHIGASFEALDAAKVWAPPRVGEAELRGRERGADPDLEGIDRD
jgi:hypothetical protein